MTNNDVLRRLRYTFNFNDKKMIELFSFAGLEVTRAQVSSWLKKEDDPEHINCCDNILAAFLNGLIIEKRGKKEGDTPVIEKKINNNLILTKLKIAFALKAEDIIELLVTVDLTISKGELSAFFRKPEHKNYRQCKDQFLRNFLKALELKFFVKRYEKKKINKTTDQNQPVDAQVEKTTYKTAKPKASKIYLNPNKKQSEKTAPSRKVLKLKPKDIWGE